MKKCIFFKSWGQAPERKSLKTRFYLVKHRFLHIFGSRNPQKIFRRAQNFRFSFSKPHVKLRNRVCGIFINFSGSLFTACRGRGRVVLKRIQAPQVCNVFHRVDFFEFPPDLRVCIVYLCNTRNFFRNFRRAKIEGFEAKFAFCTFFGKKSRKKQYVQLGKFEFKMGEKKDKFS